MYLMFVSMWVSEDGSECSDLCSVPSSSSHTHHAHAVAPSASFSGTNLIHFNLAGSVSRVTRQSDSYSTRVTTITIGFSSSSNSGTLFAMSGPVDYVFLEVRLTNNVTLCVICHLQCQ